MKNNLLKKVVIFFSVSFVSIWGMDDSSDKFDTSNEYKIKIGEDVIVTMQGKLVSQYQTLVNICTDYYDEKLLQKKGYGLDITAGLQDSLYKITWLTEQVFEDFNKLVEAESANNIDINLTKYSCSQLLQFLELWDYLGCQNFLLLEKIINTIKSLKNIDYDVIKKQNIIIIDSIIKKIFNDIELTDLQFPPKKLERFTMGTAFNKEQNLCAFYKSVDNAQKPFTSDLSSVMIFDIEKKRTIATKYLDEAYGIKSVYFLNDNLVVESFNTYTNPEVKEILIPIEGSSKQNNISAPSSLKYDEIEKTISSAYKDYTVKEKYWSPKENFILVLLQNNTNVNEFCIDSYKVNKSNSTTDKLCTIDLGSLERNEIICSIDPEEKKFVIYTTQKQEQSNKKIKIYDLTEGKELKDCSNILEKGDSCTRIFFSNLNTYDQLLAIKIKKQRKVKICFFNAKQLTKVNETRYQENLIDVTGFKNDDKFLISSSTEATIPFLIGVRPQATIFLEEYNNRWLRKWFLKWFTSKNNVQEQIEKFQFCFEKKEKLAAQGESEIKKSSSIAYNLTKWAAALGGIYYLYHKFGRQKNNLAGTKINNATKE